MAVRPSRKRKHCYFKEQSVDNLDYKIDYKDLATIRAFTADGGRIVGTRLSGVSARYQRQLALAIKRARFLALLPFCHSH